MTDADGRIGLATTIVNVSSDGDETPVSEDNCNDVGNPGQEDYDADGIGDACDQTPGWPTEDEEGISDSGADPDGNSSPGTVTTFRMPHFNLSSTIGSANDRADYYGVEHRGRTLQVQLVDLPKDYDLVVTDRTGDVLLRSALEGTRNEKVRGELPAGRYLIGVVPKPGAFDDGEYTLNVTAVK